MGRASRFGAPSTTVATRVGPQTIQMIDRARGALSRARFLDMVIATHFGMQQTEDGTQVMPELTEVLPSDPLVPPRADGRIRIVSSGSAELRDPIDGHLHVPGRPAVSRSLPGGGMITRYYCAEYPACIWTSDWS